MNIRADKEKFLLELRSPEVQKRLKFGYAGRVMEKLPNVSRTKIYSVKRGECVDWEILKEFKNLPE